MKIHVISILLCCTLALASCSTPIEFGAFDIESQVPGAVDRKGFPVVVSGVYARDNALKTPLERQKLEVELEAAAARVEEVGIKRNEREAERQRERLRALAKRHSQEALTEIKAACETLENGDVVCDTN